MSFNDEYWLWTQDISSRSNAITLIHGGLGHRPLLFEELIPCKFYLSLLNFFVIVSILEIGRHLHGFFRSFLVFAMSSAENHSMRVFYPKPTYLKPKHPLLHVQKFISQVSYLWRSRPAIAGLCPEIAGGAAIAGPYTG